MAKKEKKSTKVDEVKDSAVPIAGPEINKPEVEEAPQETQKETELSFEEAQNLMTLGECVSYPGALIVLFKDLKDGKILILNENNEISEFTEPFVKEAGENWFVHSLSVDELSTIEIYFESNSQLNEYNSLKAVSYNHGRGTSFRNLDEKISITDLEARHNIPVEIPNTAQFLMDDGKIFDYAKGEITQEEIKY